jgi:uncharacterized membrane protein
MKEMMQHHKFGKFLFWFVVFTLIVWGILVVVKPHFIRDHHHHEEGNDHKVDRFNLVAWSLFIAAIVALIFCFVSSWSGM